MDRKYNTIIIGAGNLGQALANYTDFERRGFTITSIFDINPVLRGMSIRGIPIRMMDELESYIKNNEVQIVVLTIPKEKAPAIAQNVVKWGIRAIWNFAPTDLNLPDEVMVENVHLAESLMRLSYRLTASDEQNKGDDTKSQ